MSELGNPSESNSVDAAVKDNFFTRFKKPLIAGGLAIAVVAAGVTYAVANQPAVKLVRAMSATFGDGNLDVTTSIQVTSEYLEATGFEYDDAIAGIQTPADAAAAINQAKIRVISLKSDLPKFGVHITYGTADLIGLYLIEKELYFWSDVSDLPKQSPALFEQQAIDDILPAVEFFFGGESWIASLLDGKAMKVDFAANADLNQVYEDSLAPTLAPTSGENQGQYSGELISALRDSVSITADGSDETGERFKLVVDGDSFGPATKGMIAEIGKDLNYSESQVAQAQKDWANALKGKELNIRLWLKSGKVARIQVDLANLVESSEFEPWAVVMQMDFQDPELTPPADAFDITEQAAAVLTFGMLDSF